MAAPQTLHLRCATYHRVSTTDQDPALAREELRSAAARRAQAWNPLLCLGWIEDYAPAEDVPRERGLATPGFRRTSIKPSCGSRKRVWDSRSEGASSFSKCSLRRPRPSCSPHAASNAVSVVGRSTRAGGVVVIPIFRPRVLRVL